MTRRPDKTFTAATMGKLKQDVAEWCDEQFALDWRINVKRRGPADYYAQVWLGGMTDER